MAAARTPGSASVSRARRTGSGASCHRFATVRRTAGSQSPAKVVRAVPGVSSCSATRSRTVESGSPDSSSSNAAGTSQPGRDVLRHPIPGGRRPHRRVWMSGQPPPHPGRHLVVVAQVFDDPRVVEREDGINEIIGEVAAPPRHSPSRIRPTDQPTHHVHRRRRVTRQATQDPGTTFRIRNDRQLHEPNGSRQSSPQWQPQSTSGCDSR
jgi:hypothetical protein